MPYTHYGEIGDIWKHLPLCEILQSEPPQVYIEANTAGALHVLEGTPRQRYGVYHLLSAASASTAVAGSAYVTQLRELNPGAVEPRIYPGSPALALRMLGRLTRRFVLYDIEPAALDAVLADATLLGLEGRVELRCRDSVAGIYEQLSGLDTDTLIHIDPYVLLEPNADGISYLDLFFDAAGRGIPVLAWYGYATTEEQEAIGERLRAMAAGRAMAGAGSSLCAVEVFLGLIERNRIVVNPGIVGCGVLTCHLSPSTRARLLLLAEGLCRVYGDARFEGQPGRLCWTQTLGGG